jgi:large subunit ribosomal protein L25
VLDHKTLEIDIRCRPSKLPEHVEADVSALAVGDALTIADLPIIEDVEYMGESTQVIVSVQHPTVAAEPTEDEVEEVAADEVPATKVSDDDGDGEGDDDSSKGDN